MNEIVKLSAVEIVGKIKAGELSAQEVTDAHIERIEAVDEQLNALVLPLFDQARGQAREADKAQARGEVLGHLHGVPVTIKEQFKVAGTQSTNGLTKEVGRIYQDEGPLVSRIRAAGAIILGKTNIMQYLAGWESDNPVYGRTNNPWDLERSPGGSSGGESAIIAAGGSPLGLGGDLGGSVRVPAHCTGIFGLKPTSNRLTTEDDPGGLGAAGQEAIVAQPGPMARTVADLCLAMDVLVSAADSGTTVLVPPVPWYGRDGVRIDNIRVGIYTEDANFPVSPAIRRGVKEAAEGLRACGVHVVPFEAPDVMEACRLYLGLLAADGGTSLKSALGDDPPVQCLRGTVQGASIPDAERLNVAGLMEERGQYQAAMLIRSTGRRSAEEYMQLVAARTSYRTRFLNAMNDVQLDAIISPPYALPAVRHGDSEHLFAAAGYSLLYNLMGMPAGVVAATRVQRVEESEREVTRDITDITAREVERGSAGLPVGVQVSARHWREDVVLALMGVLEEHFRTGSAYPQLPALGAIGWSSFKDNLRGDEKSLD